MGNGEIARYKPSLLFPQCFIKICTADRYKPALVWERVKYQKGEAIKLVQLSINVFLPLFLDSVFFSFLSILLALSPKKSGLWSDTGAQGPLVTFLQYSKMLREKEKLLISSKNLLFPQRFLPFLRTYSHFHHKRNCRLQTLSVWNSLNFVVWERAK